MGCVLPRRGAELLAQQCQVGGRERAVITVYFCRLNLWEMADFLKKQGIINAINLDGGGSATLVLNGTLASYPSEHW